MNNENQNDNINNGYQNQNPNTQMNNGYQNQNPNMQMNNGYQNQNSNMQMNNGYQNQNSNMQMNNGYQNQNQNMQMNNGYQNQNPNMQMNNGYQNQNPNMQMNNGYQNMNPNMQMNMNMNGFMNQNNNMEMQPVQDQFNIQQMTEYKQHLRGLKEVQSLTSEVDVQNPNSIVVFGQRASEAISKVSDEMLGAMRAIKAEEAGEMLINLTKIMDKFDVKELENVKKDSLISKLFKGVGETVAKLFQKYDTMGYEVEKVYVLLKKYENDIKESNSNLKKLYDANIISYQELEKYIVAGEMAIEEIDMYINQISNNMQIAEDEKQMMIKKLEIAKDMLSQRIYDLQVAENVAIQAAPMIQTIQMSNFNLMRKINSSFIITLPIFKQCLAQAVILKRQEIQAKSIKQLDDKTNELIMRNAANTARQSVEIAKMSSGSSIAIQTLEKSYETIMKGIEDTKAIQEANRLERKENSVKLETLKHNMKKNISSL